jgi:hypothetical protein
MSDEIGLKARAGSVSDSPTQTEPDPTPIVEAPLPGLPEAPSPTRSAPVAMSLVHYLDEPLWRAKGWIKLMGVLFILNGVLTALSLWGIVLCWLPIWLGLTLLSAAKNIRAAAELDNKECMRLALDKLGLYFKINGILIIVGLGVGILIAGAVALGILGSATMMSQGIPNMMQ